MIDYRLIRSSRRTLALEVTRDGEVLVRSPWRTPQETIDGFVKDHTAWILKNVARQKQRPKRHDPTPEEIAVLKQKAKDILPERVEYFSRLTGLKCTGIKITGAKTRFGSCSGKTSICFSYLLMQYPDEAIDYVVLHELAHTAHHDHSKRFWALVGKFMPDYKRRRELLKG